MRIHIMGNPGSGKTTLARCAGARLGVAPIDLDFVVYDRKTGRERSAAAIAEDVRARSAQQHCITEGAYHDHQANAWLEPLLAAADLIVWLDAPWLVCAWRMIQRHIRLTIAGDNPHPGWRKLLGFLNYTRRSSVRNRHSTGLRLLPYAKMVVRCNGNKDVSAALGRIVRTATAQASHRG